MGGKTLQMRKKKEGGKKKKCKPGRMLWGERTIIALLQIGTVG